MSRFSKQQASERPGDRLAGASRASASPATRGGEHPDALAGLVREAADGDPEASATLVAHVGGAILQVVRNVLGRHHPDVDDVTQDAVLSLLQALATFRGECGVDHFARRIALLTALGARRRMRVRVRQAEAEADPLDDVPGEDPSPLAGAVASRRRHLVRALLDELPEMIAEALALHFILGYTVEEIAAAVSVPANTVWSRLRLGKRALRRKLEGDTRLAEMLEVGR